MCCLAASMCLRLLVKPIRLQNAGAIMQIEFRQSWSKGAVTLNYYISTHNIGADVFYKTIIKPLLISNSHNNK